MSLHRIAWLGVFLGAACVENTPIPSGDLCAGVVCGAGQACVPATGKCRLQTTACDAVTCWPGETCVEATLACACSESSCGTGKRCGETGHCVPLPGSRCDGVACGPGEACFEETGTCSCAATSCGAGKTCGADGHCVANPGSKCEGVACGAGEACVEASGTCACAGESCGAGKTCGADGHCAVTPGSKCDGVTCGSGEACVEASGACACSGASCGAGRTCGADGHCAAVDPCAGVSCNAGESCSGGTCACSGASCGAGRTCGADGRCAADPCAGVSCNAGESCSGGTCACSPSSCVGGATCEADGHCHVTDDCTNVECHTGQTCRSGLCACSATSCPPEFTCSGSGRCEPNGGTNGTPVFSNVDRLRAFRGDFGGIYLPEIAPQCPEDPVTHIRCARSNGQQARGLVEGALFTAAYPNYTPAQRAAIRAAYVARGYTHFPISLFCGAGRWYADLYPELPCDTNTYLRELQSSGLIPVCFVLNDGATSNPLTNVDRSLCPIVVPMWEMNDPLGNDTARINEAIMWTRAAFPNTLMYVHFTPQHAAGGEPEGDWWRWAALQGDGPHVQGILYQDNRWDDAESMADRLSDFLVRLGGGYHAWPHPVDVVLFETDIYTKFWDGRSEERGVAFNNEVMNRTPRCVVEGGATYCGELAGFCSGGGSGGGTHVVPPSRVRLRSDDGHYVSAEEGSGRPLMADRTSAGPWETFLLHDLNGGALLSGDEITLKADGGKYVSAAEGGGGVVAAVGEAEAPWEKFVLGARDGASVIISGGKVSLRASGGQYVTAELGGGGGVTATRTEANAWETFQLEFVP